MEILFRGKRVTDGEWVYGSADIIGKDSYIRVVGKNKYSGEMYSEAVKVRPETVGMYTGIRSSRGTYLFQHDIVKAYTHEYVIKWGYGGFVRQSTTTETVVVPLTDPGVELVDVGNIFDLK